MSRVRVTELCQGHARCIALAPETFDFDDEGYAFVIPGCEVVTVERADSVRRAVENCPEAAIVLDEDEGDPVD